jgi:hypothetical protein
VRQLPGPGISLIVIDIVSSRWANLRDEIMRVLGHGHTTPPNGTDLYGNAYRPIVHEGESHFEIWSSRPEVDRPLPVLPLALDAEIVLPLYLETT